jgi:2'-5' RNA ligase superfamily
MTLFRHLPPSLEAELRQRLSVYTAIPPPRAILAGIVDLGGGTAFRVESEQLEDIRDELAEAFRGMLTPQDMTPWRGHVTIQNKVEPKEARRLQQQLRVGFQQRPLEITGLASWRYLGGPWQPIRTHAFRG